MSKHTRFLIMATAVVLAFTAAAPAQESGEVGFAADPGYLAALRNKPVPRAADGKPDLSGYWGDWNWVAALVGKYAEDRRREVSGNTSGQESMALTPWAQEQFGYNADPKRLGTRGRNELDPDSQCFPAGLRGFGSRAQIIQTPGKIWIIYETGHEVRQIFTDGRKHPEDLDPTWNGHSVGTWDGDTLVVDTVGFRDENWFDEAGHVFGPEMHLVERFRRVANDVLEVEMTFTDPKTFTRPFRRRITRPLAPPEWDLVEDIRCEQKYKKSIWYGEDI